MHFLKRARARLALATTPPPLIPVPGQCPNRVTSPAGSLLHLTTWSLPRQFTIEKLSVEVLLNIFCYFLDDSPRHWHTLMVICRKWRRIVSANQAALRLRLFCTHGASVSKTLEFWPTLPIVVQYGGSPALDPPAPEDEDDIMAALNYSDRVASISLTITSSLLKKLSAINRPFSDLEDLHLLSRNVTRLTFPSAFQWGPRLRRLHLTRISCPLIHLLYPSENLVELHLHELLFASHLPPEPLTKALSGMVQLRSLSLQFLSTAAHFLAPPPSGKPIVLPTLTRLYFQGRAEYLEDLVARIDAPQLGNIDVTFFHQSQSDLSTLREFTDRTGMHKSHSRADIVSSKGVISISLTCPGDTPCIKLQLFCTPKSEQLTFVAQICAQFSAFLFNVEDLGIREKQPSSRTDRFSTGQWRKLINSFTGVKSLRVTENLLSDDIVHALRSLNGRHECGLPRLHKLHILQPVPRYEPLREVMVSFMISRRLSGHPIVVEYERPRLISKLPGQGHVSQPVTIETLSEDILLNIFHHYIDASPRFWHTLVFVCQRWRLIVFGSPLGLNLRLYCTHGTPVLKTLECWPALPIIIQYGGVSNLDPPAPEDNDNIIAALKQSGRVSSISLTVTSLLLEKLSMISEPFLELEELALLSQENSQLILPSTFRWGPHLRSLHSTTIAFPSLPQLLSPCQDLVDIQLHEIPRAGYFSPESFADALSGMTQLETLSLHFLSLPPRRNHLHLPPQPEERVVLSSLTRLKYRGASKYLDSFVDRIDAPRLEDIDITFFNQPTMDASQLGRLIERIEMQTSLIQADIETSAHAISISLTNSSSSTLLRLQVSCKQLDWQLSGMAQICGQISPFLSRVNNLGLNATQPLGEHDDDVNGEQWLDLVRSFKFGRAKSFWVTGERTTDILSALGPVDDGGSTTVLPALRHLRVQKPLTMNGPLWDAIQSFITSRSISGRPVEVNAPSYQCHICHGSSEDQQGLKRHLRDNYGYQILCSYCGDFECTPGDNDLFREHIESAHPEVARNDALISKPSLSPFQLDSLFNRHSSLRAPDMIVPPSPTDTATYSSISSDADSWRDPLSWS